MTPKYAGVMTPEPKSRLVRGIGRTLRVTRIDGVWGWWENGKRTNLAGDHTFWTALAEAVKELS